MPENHKQYPSNLIHWVARLYFFLAGIQGFLVLVQLFNMPASSGKIVLLGFSPGRLVLILCVTVLIVLFIWLLIKSFRDIDWLDSLIIRLTRWLGNKNHWGITIILLALIVIGGAFFTLLGFDINEPYSKAYFIRLQPLIFWLIGLSVESLIALSILRNLADHAKLKPPSKILGTTLIVLGVCLLIWIWVAWTRIGIESETVGWNYLGAPLISTQVIIAWVIGFTILLLSPSIQIWLSKLRGRFFRGDPFFSFDVIFSLLIWLTAFILWNTISLTPSWFVSPPRPPNHELYPNSDAILYDTTAQSVLVGEGFKSWGTHYASRPMYAMFLAILHTLGGLEYEPIIFMQVAVLAIFPVLMFWIARLLHSRLAGVIVAVLVTLRESNAILLNDVITVSHSKLLMADFPTAVGIALFCVVVLTWLKHPKHRSYLTLVSGGILGAFMLIRPETGILLLITSIAILLIFYRQPSRWIAGSVMLAIGTLLVLAPWIWRNWQLDGKIFLDLPNFRADLFAKRYSENPEETSIKVEPGETYEEYSERMAENALEFVQEQPKTIQQFILSHYMNSQIQTVLLLPTTFRMIDSGINFMGHKSFPKFWDECCSVDGYVRRLPFWFKWDGVLPYQAIIPVIINLFLISMGISIAWHRNRWIGIIPITLMSAYIFINAVVRNSGGRYILPVDWVSILYFSIGLSHLTLEGYKYFTSNTAPSLMITPTKPSPEVMENESDRGSTSSMIKTSIVIVIGLLLVGFSLPLMEKVISPRYATDLDQDQIISMVNQEGLGLSDQSLERLKVSLTGNFIILQGRALYPRFYPPNAGEPGEWRSFEPRPYPRLGFYLVGPQNTGVILPIEQDPEFFPQGSDVIVIGCEGDRYFDALSVIIINSVDHSPQEILLREPFEGTTCPLPNL